MSNHRDWARAELERAGWLEDDDGFAASLLAALDGFHEYGHSGGSAAVAIAALDELLHWRPLTPLTADPSEWMDVSDYSAGAAVWQSRRHPACFSDDGGRTYWNIDEPQPFWRRHLLRRLVRGFGGEGRGLRRHHATLPA